MDIFTLQYCRYSSGVWLTDVFGSGMRGGGTARGSRPQLWPNANPGPAGPVSYGAGVGAGLLAGDGALIVGAQGCSCCGGGGGLVAAALIFRAAGVVSRKPLMALCTRWGWSFRVLIALLGRRKGCLGCSGPPAVGTTRSTVGCRLAPAVVGLLGCELTRSALGAKLP